MLVRLALDTHAHHAEADAARLQLMDAEIADYRSFLARAFGFEAPVETALAAVPGIDAALISSRARASLLREDLVALGLQPQAIDALPRCTLPSFRSITYALGWLWVIERHTLLAGLVRRHLARRLPDAMRRASAYLTASGDEPGRRFRELGDLLGRHAQRNARVPSLMAAAAEDAFRWQRRWYSPWTHGRHGEDAPTRAPAPGVLPEIIERPIRAAGLDADAGGLVAAVAGEASPSERARGSELPVP